MDRVVVVAVLHQDCRPSPADDAFEGVFLQNAFIQSTFVMTLVTVKSVEVLNLTDVIHVERKLVEAVDGFRVLKGELFFCPKLLCCLPILSAPPPSKCFCSTEVHHHRARFLPGPRA